MQRRSLLAENEIKSISVAHITISNLLLKSSNSRILLK